MLTCYLLCTERRGAGQGAGGGRRGLIPQQTQLRRRERGGQRGEPGHCNTLAAVLPQTGNVFIKTLELETKVAEYYAKFYNHGEAPTSD